MFQAMINFNVDEIKALCNTPKSLKAERAKLKVKITDELIEKIRNFEEKVIKLEAENFAGSSQLKRKLPSISLPICAAKVKRVNWLEQADGVIYMQTEKTMKLRNLLTVPQQKKCGRRPCVLALPDMGRG